MSRGTDRLRKRPHRILSRGRRLGLYTSADLLDHEEDLFGWVDSVSPLTITGWAAHRDPNKNVLAIELQHEGEVLARCHTELLRTDIAAALGRPVKAGFHLDLRGVARFHGDLLDELVDKPLVLRVVGQHRSLGPGEIKLTREMIAELSQHRHGQLKQLKDAQQFVAQRIRHLDSATGDSDVRALAFFLPQFHATSANDAWWGEGFTEWSNVAQARPLFEGHTQPRVPTTMGYYDLTAPRTLARQADLAKQYGLHGFCFYSYSFEGEGLLTDPVALLLERPDIDLPFCLCWANENWTRRWDGDNAEVLISQSHDIEQDRRYLDGLLNTFRDPRYIKVDGAPVLLVYRAGLMSDSWAVTEGWRDMARAAGFPDLYLVMAQTFGATDPRPVGFDAAVEFPPHNFPAPEITAELSVVPEFRGHVFDYPSLVADSVARPLPDFPVHKTVMPSWDNSPRKDVEGHIFHGSTPALFQSWVSHVRTLTEQQFEPSKRFMFINAWNEWAEGAHLEPDSVHGTTYLQAVRSGLAGRTGPRGALEQLRRGALEPAEAAKLADEVLRELDALERGNRTLGEYVQARVSTSSVVRLRPGFPSAYKPSKHVHDGAEAWLDHFGSYQVLDGATVVQDSRLLVSGWSLCEGIKQQRDTMSFFVLQAVDGDTQYSALLHGRQDRPDVRAAFANRLPDDVVAFAGISATLDFGNVEPGDYRVSIAYLRGGDAIHAALTGVVRVC